MAAKLSVQEDLQALIDGPPDKRDKALTGLTSFARALNDYHSTLCDGLESRELAADLVREFHGLFWSRHFDLETE